MRWSLRCTSTGSQAVALPCGASSSATTSASKKSLRAAEQDRPDVARARRCWKRRQAMLNSTRLVFIDDLPQYSPDLNPIEMPFSKLKADLRKAAEQTVPRLCRRIGSFARRLSPAEAFNYFRHAGYA